MRLAIAESKLKFILDTVMGVFRLTWFLKVKLVRKMIKNNTLHGNEGIRLNIESTLQDINLNRAKQVHHERAKYVTMSYL